LIFGTLLLCYSICLGWFAVRRLFRGYDIAIQSWAAILFGLAGLMWSVIPFAFIYGFSRTAHLYAILTLTAAYLFFFLYIPANPKPAESEHVPKSILISITAFALLIFAMVFAHTILPKADGLYVGPGTYGDLALHLGVITGLAEQQTFPPDYFFFPGVRLAYPFLVNSLSSTLYLSGMPLRLTILIPSFFLVLAVVAGFFFLAREVLQKSSSAILAAFLFFFNGGFGFVYFMNDLKNNPQNFLRLFQGTGMSPNNWGEKNLFIWNVISHILVPQRASLAGWAFLFFVLWMLYRSVTGKDTRLYLPAGIMAGLMPMIHTASYFILIAIALTWCAVYSFKTDNNKKYGFQWLAFWVPAILIALPQLFIWTFTSETSERVVRFHFNWANNADPWLWFWIKNAGIVFLLSLPAALASSRDRLRFYSGAITVFLIAEFFVFTPYHADNNKMFLIWYACTAMIVADYLVLIYQKMKGVRGRGILLGIVLFFGIVSGALTVIHDFLCSWRLFSEQDMVTAEFVRKATPPDALFISSHFHNNPVHSLAGRSILCGYDGWTFSHGLDYGPRANDIKKMYTAPQHFKPLRDQYGVDYVIYSDRERKKYETGPEYFEDNFPKIYDHEGMAIYAVSRRAIDLVQKHRF